MTELQIVNYNNFFHGIWQVKVLHAAFLSIKMIEGVISFEPYGAGFMFAYTLNGRLRKAALSVLRLQASLPFK